MIDETVKIIGEVEFGPDAQVEPYCIIGSEAAKTVIGASCIIRSHTVIYGGVVIGDGFHAAHRVLIREDTKIGDRVSLGTGTNVEHNVEIGEDVRLHSNVFVPEYSRIANGCWVGPGTILTNARYPNTPRTKEQLQGVILDEGAIVGAGVTILPGVRVGKNALIGAGSVVVRDVASGSVSVGNPAAHIKTRRDIKDYDIREE